MTQHATLLIYADGRREHRDIESYLGARQHILREHPPTRAQLAAGNTPPRSPLPIDTRFDIKPVFYPLNWQGPLESGWWVDESDSGMAPPGVGLVMLVLIEEGYEARCRERRAGNQRWAREQLAALRAALAQVTG